MDYNHSIALLLHYPSIMESNKYNWTLVQNFLKENNLEKIKEKVVKSIMEFFQKKENEVSLSLRRLDTGFLQFSNNEHEELRSIFTKHSCLLSDNDFNLRLLEHYGLLVSFWSFWSFILIPFKKPTVKKNTFKKVDGKYQLKFASISMGENDSVKTLVLDLKNKEVSNQCIVKEIYDIEHNRRYNFNQVRKLEHHEFISLFANSNVIEVEILYDGQCYKGDIMEQIDIVRKTRCKQEEEEDEPPAYTT